MTEQLTGNTLKTKLNLETATIAWRDLQRFFAAGNAIMVAPELDLINVAMAISEDKATELKTWLDEAKVQPVPDPQALQWYENDTPVWAVVISPWVLVQVK
ncbi:DUF2288 domain-containing protein [Teredinibacter franksiae]|jgi:Uncharacterized conserved small protein|uniref:DUF2288 domain-containing protein n=1 Tax=Teredinibacter franksiae TaxID=2761453 RepID=UPI001627537D|nr:DUF2288 domain-containing protein [Teredinibacter franksiae]